MKLLHLTLKKAPFEVMVTGEKKFEVREKGKWINSRLFEADGRVKHYDAIKFTNGYGKNRPYFIAKYRDLDLCSEVHKEFSNGLKIDIDRPVWVIYLGEIIEKGNLEALNHG